MPEKRKANEELIQFLAKELWVPKSSVEVISGATDTVKLVRIG